MIKFTEPPYLLTVVIGLLSWVLSQYIERVQQSPLVVYEVVNIKDRTSFYWDDLIFCNGVTLDDVDSLYVYKIKNLSNQLKFGDVDFYAKVDDGIVSSVRIMPLVPAMAGSKSASCSSQSAIYKDLSLNPFSEIHLVIGTTGNKGVPYILVGNSDKPIRLELISFKSWIIEKELTILSFMIGTLILLVTVYLLSMATFKSKEIK